MINLLSYDARKQIRAARANVTIVKCIIYTAFAILFLATYCLFAYNFAIDFIEPKTTSTSSDKSLDSKSSAILTESNEFKANLATAKIITDSRVDYSDIIIELAATLPKGVILDSLSIDKEYIGSPIQIKLLATTDDKGQEIKDNFGKSKMFSGYSVKTASEEKSNSSEYPYAISATILISKAYKS